ncbi:MAG: lipopolysaccharide transport periplasmic protein LptA [Rudaea sp.]|uniref:lipopolysaccharide transport periplasmic protein LptA n=1 Tax=Rudaea sp. TaxID=2136325 RepID=UPI0039E5B378
MKTGKTIVACGIAALLLATQAFALKSDKNQPAHIDANYSKSTQSKTGAANDPDVYDLDGNVVVTRGSIKMTSAHATVYRIPSAAGGPNAGQISRVILTGKQAHMQQVHDGDCALMTANADRIDYNPLTNLAELTGGVVVTQQGHGDSRSEHMIYNTDTGDMESGNKADPAGRVHLVMEPKAPPPPSANNCSFPAGAAKPAAPAKP